MYMDSHIYNIHMNQLLFLLLGVIVGAPSAFNTEKNDYKSLNNNLINTGNKISMLMYTVLFLTH